LFLLDNESIFTFKVFCFFEILSDLLIISFNKSSTAFLEIFLCLLFLFSMLSFDKFCFKINGFICLLIKGIKVLFELYLIKLLLGLSLLNILFVLLLIFSFSSSKDNECLSNEKLFLFSKFFPKLFKSSK